MSSFCFSEKTKPILEVDFGVNNFFRLIMYSFFIAKRINHQNKAKMGKNYKKKAFLNTDNIQKCCLNPSSSIII